MISGPSLLSMRQRDVLKKTQHQVLEKAVPLSNCIHLLWDTDTNPIANFLMRIQRSYKKTRTENTQIRCVFIRFQNPPDIRKTLVGIDGNYIFGNKKFKHV